LGNFYTNEDEMWKTGEKSAMCGENERGGKTEVRYYIEKHK
jgi:hypothetical protein